MIPKHFSRPSFEKVVGKPMLEANSKLRRKRQTRTITENSDSFLLLSVFDDPISQKVGAIT
jgi:hypothetical protein